MYKQICQFASVKAFCYIILAIHPKLMCKILSVPANHHRYPQHFWGPAGQVWRVVKSNFQLTPTTVLGKDSWSSMAISTVSGSGNHSIKCEDFHLQDTREKKQSRVGCQELFQIHSMTAMEEGWADIQQPKATLVIEAADKYSWYRRLMPSNLVSAWLLLTGNIQEERACWVFYIFKCWQSEAFFSVNLKWKFICFRPSKVICLEETDQDLTICLSLECQWIFKTLHLCQRKQHLLLTVHMSTFRTQVPTPCAIHHVTFLMQVSWSNFTVPFW